MISTQCLSNNSKFGHYNYGLQVYINFRETIKNTNTDTSIKSLRSLIRTIGGLPTSPILGKQVNTKRISQPIPSATGN